MCISTSTTRIFSSLSLPKFRSGAHFLQSNSPANTMVSSAPLLIVKVLASLGSMALCMSPVPSTYRIYTAKSTGETVLLPLVTFWMSCHIWYVAHCTCFLKSNSMLTMLHNANRTLYGYVTADVFPLAITYGFGDFMGLVYMGVFYRYTLQKRAAQKLIGLATVFVVAMTVYSVLGMEGVLGQSKDVVKTAFGYITTICSVLMYTSPLATLRRVLQTKNSASIPVALCLAGCVGNTLWVIYGLMQADVFLWGTALFCAMFALLQVVLYLVFPPREETEDDEGQVLGAKLREAHASAAVECGKKSSDHVALDIGYSAFSPHAQS